MRADIVYSTMPGTIPPNVPSLGYQATQTQEFGQGVDLAGSGGAILGSVDVLMSNWALESSYEAVGTSAGFMVPLTLNLYNVGAGNTVGSMFATSTVNASIAWRPEADPSCGSAWLAGNGQCYNGLAQVVTFNLNNLLVPDQFIYGLTFNTQTHGYSPTGNAGPYNSLNFGLAGDGFNSVTPSVGYDLVADSAYWNTNTAGYYGDNGVGGTGAFRLDANDWQGYDPAVAFNAVPEPPYGGLFVGLLALAGILVARRRTVTID